jgi:beta-N-acetylhexosaminidase
VSQDTTLRADLVRLAEAILIPPFPGSSAPRWILDALGRGLGGVTLFGQNISTPDQVTALTASLRAAGAEDDPVIAIDEEGGDVTRVAYSDGSPYPGNAALGAVDDTSLTRLVYRAIGADLAALGINLNLAPCADVLSSADSPAVGTRSFGADTELVSRHTAAAVTGLQSAGVAACTKHFPGHGRTGTDSHEAIATIEGGLDELRLRDLPPFAAAIKAGTIAIMPSHLRIPELTGDLPATVSGPALAGLLRGELGFTGVIVSDALEMRATRDMFGIPRAAVLAVAAGTDVVCLGRDGSEEEYLAVRSALVTAVRDGTLAGSRLEEAADRVARLRGGLARARSAAAAGPAADGGSAVDGRPAAGRAGTSASGGAMGTAAERADRVRLGLAAARRAARMSGPRPVLRDPLIIEVEPRENIAAGRFGWGLGPWAPAGSVRRVSTLNGGPGGLEGSAGLGGSSGLQGSAGLGWSSGLQGSAGLGGSSGPQVSSGLGGSDGADGAGAGLAAEILEAAAGRPLVVVVRDAHRDQNTRSLVIALLAARPELVLVEMGLPLWRPPEGTTYLATYGASRASAQAAAELLGLTEK